MVNEQKFLTFASFLSVASNFNPSFHTPSTISSHYIQIQHASIPPRPSEIQTSMRHGSYRLSQISDPIGSNPPPSMAYPPIILPPRVFRQFSYYMRTCWPHRAYVYSMRFRNPLLMFVLKYLVLHIQFGSAPATAATFTCICG